MRSCFEIRSGRRLLNQGYRSLKEELYKITERLPKLFAER